MRPVERDDLVDIERIGKQRRHQHDQLADGEVADQGAGLEHPSHQSRVDGLARRPAEDADGSAVRLGEAEQHVDRRRLARAVGPEQRHGLPGAIVTSIPLTAGTGPPGAR